MIAAPTNLTPVSAAPTVILPKPVLRTVPGEDPETAANRAADFAPEPVVASTGSDAKMAAGSKHIRIVGPSYYYGQ